jgi:WD40 repeat protein
VETGKVVWDLTKPGHVTISLFSPDETLALLAWNDDASESEGSSTIQLHDAATGEPVGPTRAHDMPSSAAAFTPDGQSFAVASGTWADDRQRGSLSMWTLEGEDWVFAVSTPSMITDMRFAPDGERLLTGHADFKVREWDLIRGGTTGAPEPRLIASQQGPVWRVYYHPLDPGRIVTGCFDGTVRIWELATGTQIGPPLRHDMLVRELAMRRDGSGFATGALDHSVRLWRAPVFTPDERPGIPLPLGPDRRIVLQGDERNVVSLRDLASGEILGAQLPHPAPLLLHQSSLSRDSTMAATLDVNMQARLWNLETGRLIVAPADSAFHVAISPDGRRMAIGTWNAASIWDTATGRKLLHLPLSTQAGPVFRVDFSPDGRLLVGGGADSAAHLWDAATGAELASFPHATAAASVTFSPDGGNVAVGGHEGTRIWNVSTHQPVGRLLPHDTFVQATAFSPDGRLLLSGGNEGHVRLWHLASGKRIGPPSTEFGDHIANSQPRSIGTVGFLPDGSKAYAGPGDYMAINRQTAPVITRFWNLPAPVAGKPEDIRIWVESITGMTLHENGGVSVLSAKQWEIRRSEAEGRKGTAGPVSTSRD